MGNKQEEPEFIIQTEGYDLIGTTEPWCDGCHDWSVAVDAYELFKKNYKSQGEGGVALYVRKCMSVRKYWMINVMVPWKVSE